MEAIFDHEKLDVYGHQLQFVAWTPPSPSESQRAIESIPVSSY
jgi:hypothetical protein